MEGSTICDWGSAVVLWEVGFVPSLLLRCPAYFPSLADSILSTSPHSCFLSAQLPQKQKVDSLKDPSSLLLPTLASFLLSCHRSRRWLSQRPYSQTLQPSASIQGGLNSFPPPSLSFSGLEYSSSPFVAL